MTRRIDWQETDRRISERKEPKPSYNPESPTVVLSSSGAWHLNLQRAEWVPVWWHRDRALAFGLLAEMLESREQWVLIGPSRSPDVEGPNPIEIEITPTETAWAAGARGGVLSFDGAITPAHIAEAWCRVMGVEIAYTEAQPA